LATNFKNNNSIQENKFAFHLVYFDQNNNSFNEFNHEKNKIILGVFDFTKNQNNQITGISYRDITNITLDSINYKIRNDETVELVSYIDGGQAGFSITSLPNGTFLQGNADNQILGIPSQSGNLVTLLDLTSGF
jgi:hypothetical protein